MIRIALVGDIGSGKTFISNLFGYPTFSADKIVSQIYKKDKKVFFKLKKKLPESFLNFPIKKDVLIKAITKNEKNIQIISSIVHPVVKKYLTAFLKKNKSKKIVILDIPLFFENKLNKKNDKVIFIDSKPSDIVKKLSLRKNFNKKILKKLKKLQFPITYKKSKSNYVIKNNFDKVSACKAVKTLLKNL